MRDSVSWMDLVGQTITEVKHGSPELPKGQTYGVYTLKTKAGREFIVTQCMGEVNLSEVKK